MKSFELKIYSRNGTFKKNVNPKTIISEISFSEDLEGGQGNMNIQYIGSINDVLSTDIIEIREVDEENKQISATYTGIVEEVSVIEYPSRDVVNIEVLGIFTALNDVFFKTGGNRVFTSNLTAGNLVKAIIDSFNADYGTLSGGDTQNLTTNLIRYTGSSIDITGANVNIDFDNESCLSAIKKVLDNTGFSFYIGSDGIISVQKDAGQSSVSLTMGRQIILIDRKVHKREMVNKYYHERVGANEQLYTDPTSIALFGIKEKKDTNSDIQDATSQNTIGNKKIADYAYERNEIVVHMKPQKTNSIVPGNLLSANNVKIPLINKKITKISKSRTEWTVFLGDFISFGNSVIKK